MPQDNQWQVVGETSTPSPQAPAQSNSWQVVNEAPAPQQGDYLSKTEDLISKGEDAVTDMGTGFLKGAGQTVNTISNAISKVAPSVVRPTDVQGLQRIETPTNTAQQVGVVGEGIGEFFLGDEALKGLSLAERLGLAARVAKLAEAHPVVGKLITAGLNAIRQGSVAGTQALAHGEPAGQALMSGVTAAGTGAALEGAGNIVKALAPKVEKVAGVEIPVRASNQSKLADAAETVSRSKPLQEFDAQQTQPAGRRAIGSVATDVKNTAAAKMGNDTGDFRLAMQEIGNGKQFADLTTPQKSQVLARAQELKTARNGLSVASKAADFGDAADQVRAQAKPIYAKLDDLTADRDKTFSDLQREERAAFIKDDFEGVNRAQKAQDKIFDEFKDQFSDPDAYQKARQLWRQASALDKLHDTITSKSVMESTPNNLIPKGVPDPRYIKGKQFGDAITFVRDIGLLKDAGLSKQHVQDLEDVGRLLRKGGEIQKTDQLAKALKAAKVTVGGPATGFAGYGASAVLGRIMTDPQFAAKAVKTLQAGQRVAPAVSANLYREAASALGGSPNIQ